MKIGIVIAFIARISHQPIPVIVITAERRYVTLPEIIIEISDERNRDQRSASEGNAKARGDGRIAATIVNPSRFPARLLFYASSAAAAAAFVVISWRCDF